MSTSSYAVGLGMGLWVAAVAGASAPIDTKHLTVAAPPVSVAVAPGARVSLTLDVTPKRTMHVYAPEQKDAGFIPISLTIDPNPAITASAVQFPRPERLRTLDDVQLVYSKPFRIVQPVIVAATPAVRNRARTPGATVAITGTLRYQACDDTICYVPVTVPVAWTIPLQPATR